MSYLFTRSLPVIIQLFIPKIKSMTSSRVSRFVHFTATIVQMQEKNDKFGDKFAFLEFFWSP